MSRILALLLALLVSIAPAIADETIDQLTGAGALTGSESVPIFQSANPAVKTTTQSIANLAVTSISPGCGASTSPNPITRSGTASVLLTPVTISGASPAVSATGSPFGTNCGSVVYLTNAGSDTPTIPEAGTSGYSNGFFETICVPVAFTKTITPGAGTIGGAASYALAGGTNSAPSCIRVQSDGVSNYSISEVSITSPASLTLADQTMSGGANITSNNLGTVSSGTLTIDCGKAPLQYATNNGAFTLAAPSNDGSCLVLVTNGASAGTITFSGFSVGSNTGDTYATTNTNKYTLDVWRINGTSGYRWAAHQ